MGDFLPARSAAPSAATRAVPRARGRRRASTSRSACSSRSTTRRRSARIEARSSAGSPMGGGRQPQCLAAPSDARPPLAARRRRRARSAGHRRVHGIGRAETRALRTPPPSPSPRPAVPPRSASAAGDFRSGGAAAAARASERRRSAKSSRERDAALCVAISSSVWVPVRRGTGKRQRGHEPGGSPRAGRPRVHAPRVGFRSPPAICQHGTGRGGQLRAGPPPAASSGPRKSEITLDVTFRGGDVSRGAAWPIERWRDRRAAPVAETA